MTTLLTFSQGYGDKGGKIVAEGTPAEITKNKKSYTGKYLKV